MKQLVLMLLVACGIGVGACQKNEQPAADSQDTFQPTAGAYEPGPTYVRDYPEPASERTGTTTDDASPEPAADRTAEDEVLTPTGSEGRTYVVQKGDTLYSIARKFYNGDQSRWRVIYEANRSRLRGPDQLAVGMKLIIP